MASKYIQKFEIPNDLPKILHDLTKEVLRYQPDDIIEFCALYFKCFQEGKELDYTKKGINIPCDFENVVPGVNNDNQRIQPEERSQENLSNVVNHNRNSESNKVISNIEKKNSKKGSQSVEQNDDNSNKEDNQSIQQNNDKTVSKENSRENSKENSRENSRQASQESEEVKKRSISPEEAKNISKNYLNELLS